MLLEGKYRYFLSVDWVLFFDLYGSYMCVYFELFSIFLYMSVLIRDYVDKVMIILDVKNKRGIYLFYIV